ncbi:MAG: IPT/TIG domain-containing protein [Deltaproteobacteria bacterium]|nr:IPT/TIG domain-containing protein [Deltaproteobacteria bacterium]
MKLFLLLALFACITSVSDLQAAERPQRVRPQAAPAPAPAAPAVPSILSIIPAQGEPGGKVTIFGSSFGEQASVFLGSVENPARVTDGKQLEFVIPKLEAGLYALYVRRADGVAGRVYNFTVQATRPVLTSLAPDTVNACASGSSREVTASGRNFIDSSALLFDGAVISSRVVSPEQILFTVPQAAGGLHQVMVKNDAENGTLPLTLTLESRPEISQVSIGNEFVNYYELNIHGKNFQQNSSIYVDGQKIGGKGGQESIEREKLIYVDCTRMIYQRYPYSSTNKDFRLQVVNQAGEGSQVVNVTAP